MANDSVTLVLNGEVPLDDFVKAIDGFMRLIDGLRKSVAGNAPMDWVVSELEAGSAVATVRGRPLTGDDYAPVRDVVRAYERVTESFQQGIEPAEFPQAVLKPVRDILSVINGRISSVRFETEESDAEVTPESVAMLSRPSRGVVVVKPLMGPVISFGSVRGRVQSMTSRQQLRFTLYDVNSDRPISCYLEPGSEDQMREAWGHLTIVEGMVRRDSKTGQPLTIRQVRNVIVLEDMEPGSWRRAIGAIPHVAGVVTSEEAVRRGRNE